MTSVEIPLRIVVEGPPPGVWFRVQRGRTDLVPPSRTSERALSFDLVVRVGEQANGRPNFLGEFAQGPPSARFVYVNSGLRAGQAGSCWDRRAKVSLVGITREQVDAVRSRAGVVLEARIAGMACDGGPSCATVPLLDGGWTIADADPSGPPRRG